MLPGVALIAWSFLPLLVFALALLGAVVASIAGRLYLGRALGAFGLVMLLYVPVYSVATSTDLLVDDPTLWPIGYGLLTSVYALASLGLLVYRRRMVDWGLRRIGAQGTEHEQGLGVGANAGLVALGVYLALQPAVILVVSRLR